MCTSLVATSSSAMLLRLINCRFLLLLIIKVKTILNQISRPPSSIRDCFRSTLRMVSVAKQVDEGPGGPALAVSGRISVPRRRSVLLREPRPPVSLPALQYPVLRERNVFPARVAARPHQSVGVQHLPQGLHRQERVHASLRQPAAQPVISHSPRKVWLDGVLTGRFVDGPIRRHSIPEFRSLSTQRRTGPPGCLTFVRWAG